MALNPSPHTPDHQTGLRTNNLEIQGYTRLRFFNFKIWQLAVLFVLLIFLALVLFPRRKMLINYYKDRGMYDEAISTLSDAQTKSPQDTELFLISADLYIEEGEPGKAINALENYIDQVSNNKKGLLRLAALYEDSRQPQKAMGVWEKITTTYPQESKAWQQLITYYSYYNLSKKQVDAITRYFENRVKNSDSPGSENDNVSRYSIKDPLVEAIQQEITHLIAIRSKTQKHNPLLDELIRSLFIKQASISTRLKNGLDAGFPDSNAGAIRFLEEFVRTGMIREGMQFARSLDTRWAQGLQNRLLFIKVLRWNRLDKQAMNLLAQIYESENPSKELLKDIITIARDIDDLQTAIAIYQRLIKREPDNIEYQRELAELYLQDGKPYEAYSTYKNAIGTQRVDKAYIQKLFQLAGYTTRKDVAVEAAQIAGKLHPQDPAVLIQSAEMLLSNGDQKDAIRAYQKYLRLRPDDLKAQNQLAELYTWEEQPRKAYPIYKRLAIRSKGRKKQVDKMLDIASATENPKTIQESVSIAIRLRPKDKTYKRKAAELLLAAGKEQEAIRAFQRYLTLNPDDDQAKQQLIQLYQWSNQSEQAVEVLTDHSDQDPGNFKKAVTAGNRLVDMGNTASGVVYLKRASRIKPMDIPLRKRLATYYGWLNRNDSMIQELEFLDSVGRLSEADIRGLAQSYLDRKKGNKALKLLKPYETRVPLPKEEGLMLTTAYEQLGNIAAVTAIYKRLAAENAGDADLLADLGNRSLWMQKTHTALAFYKMALRKDPKQLQALKGSSQIYAWNNDPQRAIDGFEAYNRLNPNDYEVRYQLGELYFTNGRRGDAFKEYRKAMALMKQAKGDTPSPYARRSTPTQSSP